MKESSSSVLQSDEEVPAKYVPAPIVIPSDNLEWDESYHPDVPLTRADNQSDQMAVTSNNIYDLCRSCLFSRISRRPYF